MAEHVDLIREAAEKVRAAGQDLHVVLYARPAAGPLIADLLEGAAHREEEYLAGLPVGHGVGNDDDCLCAEPERGDEAGLAVALARALLGRTGG